MTAIATFALTYLAEGRGEDPSGAGGVLLVAGIALAVLLIAGTALFFVSRTVRARRAGGQAEGPSEQPLPSEQGRPWSSSSPDAGPGER